MKEAVLALKKVIIPLEDMMLYFYEDEKCILFALKEEYNKMIVNLSKEDLFWIDKEISKWYERYLYLEVIGSMKPI